MRLSYTLLVLAAPTLVANGMATASGHSTDVTTMVSPNLVGVSQTISGEKRSLRYRADDELDDSDDDEERRFTNLFATNKIDAIRASLRRAENGDAGGLAMVEKRFGKWETKGYTPSNLPSALNAEKYKQLRQKFRTWTYYGHL
ncbi:RxLR effector protein [Phytophthora megakarya]|uniref:RxLR effector protein n=1 Tax=Phytophthora megakarya TaxID=4795 RepID=A0A225V0V2_9STRA|nr:RxLR effector protein [Phytophthora megakarya]